MGAIANAIMDYALPLLEQTDGSHDELNRAMLLTQFCYNLSLLETAEREEMLSDMRHSLGMGNREFAELRRSTIEPMIQRHQQMFPLLHQRARAAGSPTSRSGHAHSRSAEPAETAPPVTDRYAPCPCNSGRKYKFCCGIKRR